jgi:prevent-host-death family protein
MGTTISQRELRNDSGEIMRRVERGERFTVTRNGTPIADLVPHDMTANALPRFVPVQILAAGVAELPEWGTSGFTNELSDLDATIDDRDIDRWNETG